MILRFGWISVAFLLFVGVTYAQSDGFGVQGNQGDSQVNNEANSSPGAPGGAANADFDSLIDLIVSTVSTETWAETGGGQAEIRPFPTGVYIDPEGVLQQVQRAPTARLEPQESAPPSNIITRDVRQASQTRYVSLRRLESEIAHRMQEHLPLDEEMLTLAGLRRVERVLIYPEVSDVLLIGPAGDWMVNEEHRLVSKQNGQAVLRLDDLLVLLRREHQKPGTPFGCAITPRREALTATQRYLNQTTVEPLQPGRKARETWLAGIQTTLGRQDIEVFGIDPATNAARVLVEADHHMKQVGLGEAEGVEGLKSYMDRVAELPERNPLSVLRWWFSLGEHPVVMSHDGLAMRFLGNSVRVLSENELLTLRGERIHTGLSDEPTRGFADEFTASFDHLSIKYPVYGELRNLFDLALVAMLIERSGLWSSGSQSALFLDAERLPLPRQRVATEVDTLLAHRLLPGGEVLAAVSGGVWAEPKGASAGPRASERFVRPALPEPQPGVWWWDLE